MKGRLPVCAAAVAVAAARCRRNHDPVAAAGQTGPDGWTPPRTPWGAPDLQGVWDFRTITPLERPAELAGRRVLTAEEAASFEASENRRLNRDLVDPKLGGAIYPPESQGGVVPYNEFWYDRGNRLVGDRRTSLIVDPPDGRIPPLTPAGQARAEARRAHRRDHPADSWEDRSLADRCIVGFNAGPPLVPGAYNNNVQLLQTPDQVVIFTEMIHNARIIRLDGRARTAPSRSGTATRAPAGRTRPSSSRPATSTAWLASGGPRRTCTSWNASRASARTPCCTSSLWTIPSPGRDPGPPSSR